MAWPGNACPVDPSTLPACWIHTRARACVFLMEFRLGGFFGIIYPQSRVSKLKFRMLDERGIYHRNDFLLLIESFSIQFPVIS